MISAQYNQSILNRNSLTLSKKESIQQNQKVKDKLTFTGKTINGKYYTDRDYVDAMNYKDEVDWEEKIKSDIIDRYNFFECLFTDKPEKHVARVKECIADIKAEEAEKLRKQEEELKKVQAELERATKKTKAQEHAIKELSTIVPNKGLGKCIISDELYENLKEEFIKPFALDKISREEGFPEDVPNGLLLQGSDPHKTAKVAEALAEQVLQDKFPVNFIEVSMKDDDLSGFIDDLTDIKEKASSQYDKSGQRTIILIKNFDELAVEYDQPKYDPSLNGFLKNYFMDCADSGCTILATAKDPDSIESAFTVNRQRFAIKVSIDN